MSDLTVVEHDAGVVELVLARAPVNALTADYMEAIRARLRQLNDADRGRAILISSPLKVLSAGLDLKEARLYTGPQQRAVVKGFNTLFPDLFALPKPTIVAVNGPAIAGGLFFVLACDWRVSGAQARFGLAEVRVGADLPIGPMEIARDQLTPADLRRLMLRGRPYVAETALSAGIIDEISDEPHQTALLRAGELASLPPQTYASIKAQTRAPALARIKAELAAEVPKDWFREETRAAMAAMLEK